MEKEPEILLAWAKWHYIKNDVVEAENYALDALRIGERCEYRLMNADLNNFLAFLALNNDHIDESISYARKAYYLSLCDGNNHSYMPALENSNIIINSIQKKYKKKSHFIRK